VEFEWDENKNRLNLAKHGISFEDAIEIFEDPRRLTEAARVVGAEARQITLGKALTAILLVVHVQRVWGREHRVRVISARPASRKERLRYERGTDRPL
jgi:uncharacterized DUF497 family protein